MPQSEEAPKDNSNTEGHKRPNLSRWFWGTIVLLLVTTVSLELFAAWQAGRQGVENGSGSSVDQTGKNAKQVEQWFNTANEEARKVREQIPGLLEEAYAPVYAGIPKYMDFHYSLTGEWLELGAAAIGNLGGGLEEHLFDGFDTRLGAVSEHLALEFDQIFQKALDEAMAAEPGGAEAFGPVATRALRDSQNRMKKTTGTVGVVLVGGATLKVFTTAFAKKLAIKLAAKVGTKTGMKWAATVTGGAASSAACSWTGPGAVACAVVGAAITWVVTDVAMINLDEYVTRDDFERDLRALIDDHKKETQHAMEQMLASKILAVETERKVVVRDISLSELKDADRLMVCEAAASILGRYVEIRGNLQARSSTNIASFQADLRAQETSYLLAPWIDTMKAAITDQDLRPWIFGPVILNVDFPDELHEGRKIWGELRLAETVIEFVKTESDSDGKYSLRADVGEKIVLEGKRRLELELVQDRGWTSWNRDFEGIAWLDVSENFSKGSGIAPKAAISLTMASVNKGGPAPRVEVVLIPGGAILPGRELPKFCTQ
ncbi:hypothetical protein [Falsiruegeria mediterranea]|uniref:Uncharacterized protein n=1 Tax=Falsiruegeria mediterranea M17 TaxID=1200281 RepID=A0A2R8CAL4_9RHOB|nr:hypothetical protein [Falsiruegeria mediterranea]SPJ29423.1 hypothetical protein TRM7615_02941 [Falsiruegeria mediterranea M17]